MFGNGLLNKDKGFLLLSTYVAIIVLMIFGLAMFGRSMHEHKFSKRSFDDMAARYAAERGINHVIAEVNFNGNFHTHQQPEAVNNYELISDNAFTTANLKMDNVIIDADGNYASNVPNEKSRFIVKVYSDPLIPDETVILSKGISGNESCLMVSKYVPSSLYRFFIFTPSSINMGSSNYQASGGKIHANDYIYFSGGADINDVTELSTAKYFKEAFYNFAPSGSTGVVNPMVPRLPGDPPTYFDWEEVLKADTTYGYYGRREPWTTPNNTTIAELKYYNRNDGINLGDSRGLLMLQYSGKAKAWDGVNALKVIDPYSPANFNFYSCKDNYLDCRSGLNDLHTSVNGVKIPGKFSTTGYTWDKYYGLPEFFSYKKTRFYTPDEPITMYHFNSEFQYQDWINFLAQHPDTLEGVMLDANTGGTHYEPLTIEGANFKIKAEQDGIYIKYVESTDPEYPQGLNIVINGSAYNLPEGGPSGLTINGQTDVFKKNSFVDPNSTNTKNVITLDIGKLKLALGNNAGLDQNILYSNYPIVLTNASSILNDGLTTVCEENIYLHGNYNSTSNAESAAISAKYTYTLTSSWDYPQDLQSLYHNPNFPYENDFYCPSIANGGQTCINTYFGGDATKGTNAAYPTGRNWYFENYATMPNYANDASSNVYNLALVGYYTGDYVSVLERWSDYIDPGSNYTTEGANMRPPSGWRAATRYITGARVKLENSDFPSVGVRDDRVARLCSAGFFPCRNDQYPGWFYSTYNPSGDYDNYYYNTNYADGYVPPGDLLGFTSTVFLELDNSDEKWNYHSIEISLPPS